MHGLGNDFVMLDVLDGSAPADPAALSRKMNDRRFGIGGDGLILVERGEDAPYRMRMFNPDGSEAEMCGNGIRCFARLLRDRGYLTGPDADVETGAGRLVVHLTDDGQVRVNMGKARLQRGEIPVIGETTHAFINQPIEGESWLGTAVSMGNPHLVIFTEDVSLIPLE